jgi:hypothetical protein
MQSFRLRSMRKLYGTYRLQPAVVDGWNTPDVRSRPESVQTPQSGVFVRYRWH